MSIIQGWHVADETRAGGKGYTGRDLAANPLHAFAKPFSLPRLDMATIKELIREKTANKSWIKDHCDRVGLGVKNQQSSSYCWYHGFIRTMEAAMVLAGGLRLPLSAFYGASRIKNGRNEGGSGVVAAQWTAEHGTCLEKYWPPMKFRGDVTPEILANAQLHKPTLQEECDPSDHELIYSAVCQDQAVTVGIPIWGHEVAITFLVLEGDTVYPGIDNSWGPDYGTNGRAVLHGAYTRFDEAMRIAAVSPSVN
jgi:hypothetical protein